MMEGGSHAENTNTHMRHHNKPQLAEWPWFNKYMNSYFHFFFMEGKFCRFIVDDI